VSVTGSSFCDNVPNHVLGEFVDGGGNDLCPLCDEGAGNHLDVPATHSTIQAAVDAACDGAEIVVAPGTYFETVNLGGKAITLRSSHGAALTTIDGQGSGPIVVCANGEGNDTAFRGFTVTHGGAQDGGGMHIYHSSPRVEHCVFVENVAESGGGMYSGWDSSPVFDHCVFAENVAVFGGGINSSWGSPEFDHCDFVGNTAESVGGGISVWGSATFSNCTIDGNSATSGGGMRGGGDPTLVNCLFIGNTAETGAGIDNGITSPATLINCTIVQNTATVAAGAIRNWGFCIGQDCINSDTILINCVLSDNGPQPITNSVGTVTVSYSTVEGNWPGTGNIDADPMFTDPDNGDFRLAAGSPCIDAGHNNATAGLTQADLEGNPRFADDTATVDTGCGLPVVVDMGAYEYQGDPADVIYADLTGDGDVGPDDFAILMDCWYSPAESCCVADLDLDGTVGIVDFLRLLASWG
jgi:hypothetical protein